MPALRAAGVPCRLNPVDIASVQSRAPSSTLSAASATVIASRSKPVSYTQTPVSREAIVLGYTHLRPEQIRSAVDDLASLLSTTDRGL